MIPKYKAWDKNQQIMRGVRGLFWTKNNLVVHCSPIGNKFDEFFTTILNDGEYHLMQSTGQFDKNSKEIFEGDIVYAYSEGARLVGAIEYFDNAYCIKTKNGVYNSLWTNAEYYEVVGNVFENQELVEELK